MNNERDERNPLKKNNSLLLMCAAVLLVVVAVTLLLPSRSAAPGETDAANVAAGEQVKVADGAELFQTLTYTRCEHVVTRRVTAPVELYGKTLEEVQPLYEEWQITEFSPKIIKMEQQPDIFCPDHMVLMPNGAGKLCVFQNKYGDALALINELEIDLRSLPAAIQEELDAGVGFSTPEEMEQWLESVES
ncbi:MAG: hypothetical protein PHI98_00770 [Eubacteriales bacterium]|nr:hypothetical protein [Eubacteriales bacterium]